MTNQTIQTKSEELYTFACKQISHLQRQLLSDNPATAALAAKLRRCPLDQPGADPSVWEITFGDIPESLLTAAHWKHDEITPVENAFHATLVLWALHQQSQNVPTHKAGIGLGQAVAALSRARGAEATEDASSIKKLHQVVLSSTPAGRLHYLRGLVSLFRTETPPIVLDYGQLAVDLFQLFDSNYDNTRVLARWGRGLHQTKSKSGEKK